MDAREQQDYQRRYAETTKASKFVLCPRGLSVSSISLFETMRMGRVPVILAGRLVSRRQGRRGKHSRFASPRLNACAFRSFSRRASLKRSRWENARAPHGRNGFRARWRFTASWKPVSQSGTAASCRSNWRAGRCICNTCEPFHFRKLDLQREPRVAPVERCGDEHDGRTQGSRAASALGPAVPFVGARFREQVGDGFLDLGDPHRLAQISFATHAQAPLRDLPRCRKPSSREREPQDASRAVSGTARRPFHRADARRACRDRSSLPAPSPSLQLRCLRS